MLLGVNRVRADHGLPVLVEDSLLDQVATERSQDMAARRYFGHVTPDGSTVFDILQRRGIAYRIAGENLAWNTAGDDEASEFALQGFLNSPPHRDNVLRASFGRVGVGVARDGGKLYFTLVFMD